MKNSCKCVFLLNILYFACFIFFFAYNYITMEEKDYINDINNERADAACARLSEKSRSLIISLFEKGFILVNDKPIKKSAKLKAGDKIHITFPDEELPCITPQNIPFDIILDKANYAVINKPAGLTVHPAPGNYDNTLVNALLYAFVIEDEDNLQSFF